MGSAVGLGFGSGTAGQTGIRLVGGSAGSGPVAWLRLTTAGQPGLRLVGGSAGSGNVAWFGPGTAGLGQPGLRLVGLDAT